MSPKIGAVITSFNPPVSFLKNIESIASQCSTVVVVDNNSCSGFLEILPQLVAMAPHLIIIQNTQNLGVATALNQGIKKILDRESVDWIATFDHDTKIPKEYFKNLLNGKIDKSIGIVSPVFTKIKRPREVKIDAAITSGACHRANLFTEVGYFLDSLFIDCVDFEYCLRVRTKGFDVLQNQHISIQHSIGHSEKKRFGPISIYYHKHSPLRKYYIARNSIWLQKKYFRRLPLWCIKYFLALTKDFIKDMIFNDERSAIFFAYCKGVAHGTLKPSPHSYQ